MTDAVFGPHEQKIIEWARKREYFVSDRIWFNERNVIRQVSKKEIEERRKAIADSDDKISDEDYAMIKLGAITANIQPSDLIRNIYFPYGRIRYTFSRINNRSPSINSEEDLHRHLERRLSYYIDILWTIGRDVPGWDSLSLTNNQRDKTSLVHGQLSYRGPRIRNYLLEFSLEAFKSRRPRGVYERLLASVFTWGNREFASFCFQVKPEDNPSVDVSSMFNSIDLFKKAPRDYEEFDSE